MNDKDLRPLHQMIDALPTWWTPDVRRRWLQGMAALVDWAIEMRPAPYEEETK